MSHLIAIAVVLVAAVTPPPPSEAPLDIVGMSTSPQLLTSSGLVVLPDGTLLDLTKGDGLMMVSSSNIVPFFEFEYRGVRFTVAAEYEDRFDFLSTADPRFETPEGIRVGMTLSEIQALVDLPVEEERGYSCYVKLPSGWNADLEIRDILEVGWRRCEEQVQPDLRVSRLYRNRRTGGGQSN